jgi:hypothetical protein
MSEVLIFYKMLNSSHTPFWGGGICGHFEKGKKTLAEVSIVWFARKIYG